MSTRRWKIEELAGDPKVTSLSSYDPLYNLSVGDAVEEEVLGLRFASGEYLVSQKSEIKTRARNRSSAPGVEPNDSGEDNGDPTNP